MRPDDGWLIFALGITVGFVVGWLCHGLYLAARDAARFVVTAGRKLYGWHRARDSQRLAALEAQMADIHPTLT